MARCGKCDRVEEGSGGYGRNTWRYHVNFRSVTRLTVILADGKQPAGPRLLRLSRLHRLPQDQYRAYLTSYDCGYLPAGTGCESYRITVLPF